MKARGIIAALSCIVLSASLCSCEGSPKAREREALEQQEGETSQTHTGLPDGLTGTCTTDDPRMSSITISTSDGQLHVRADTDGDFGSPEYYGLFVSIIPDEDHYIQVGFKDTGAETVSFVFDAGEAQQYDYGEWDTSTISSGVMLGTVPTERIPSSDDVEWNAALSINGRDEVTCPVDGKADLE